MYAGWLLVVADSRLPTNKEKNRLKVIGNRAKGSPSRHMNGIKYNVYIVEYFHGGMYTITHHQHRHHLQPQRLFSKLRMLFYG